MNVDSEVPTLEPHAPLGQEMKSDSYAERNIESSRVPTLEPGQEAVKSDELPLVRVVIECNTFDFYVKEADRRRKRVTVMQHTDFSGTILENDFPNGDTSRIVAYAPDEFSDIEVINLVGARLIKAWEKQEKKYPSRDEAADSGVQKPRPR